MSLEYLLKLSDEDIIKKIKGVVITYFDDNSKKRLTPYQWIAFKKQIIDNLYNKEKCSIHFVKKLKYSV